MSYGTLSVEGGSNLLKEADVEMLDEEDKEKEEEEDAADGVTSTVQVTVEEGAETVMSSCWLSGSKEETSY